MSSISAEIKRFSVQIVTEAHLVLEALQHAPMLHPQLPEARDAHQEPREQAHLRGVALGYLGLQGLDQQLLKFAHFVTILQTLTICKRQPTA